MKREGKRSGTSTPLLSESRRKHYLGVLSDEVHRALTAPAMAHAFASVGIGLMRETGKPFEVTVKIAQALYIEALRENADKLEETAPLAVKDFLLARPHLRKAKYR